MTVVERNIRILKLLPIHGVKGTASVMGIGPGCVAHVYKRSGLRIEMPRRLVQPKPEPSVNTGAKSKSAVGVFSAGLSMHFSQLLISDAVLAHTRKTSLKKTRTSYGG